MRRSVSIWTRLVRHHSPRALGALAPRTPLERKTMKTAIQTLRLGLLALLLTSPVQSSVASPPRTGIRGQTLIYHPGFAVEVSPGVWIGDGGFSFGWPASLTVFSAYSGREVAH